MQEGGLRSRPINGLMVRSQEDFRAFVSYGKEWEWKVFRMLRQRYPDIRRPKTLEEALAIPRGQRDEESDIALLGMPIECKRRKFQFTNASDYPYQSFYIDEEYKLRDPRIPADEYAALPEADRLACIKPFCLYMTCNADMTHMGVVIPASKPYWRLDSGRLRLDDRQHHSWACALNKVIFLPVTEWRSILTRI